MSKLNRTVLLLALLWIGLLAQVEGASARLGIVTSDPSVATLADLLTVKFSQTDQLVMLERAKVNKIWQEQVLKATQAGNYRGLGEVLGADGIVLLETLKDGGESFLISRLLSVRSGIVVGYSRHKLPIADPPGWCDLFVRRQVGLVPKLSIKREEAVPLSYLNVRASLALASSTAMEQQLNILLNHRLMSRPELFLLERRRLDTLAAEKELQQVDDPSFWTGSYILDGIIDRDGVIPGKVTLTMTLQPPKQQPKVQFEVTGERENLPAIAEQIMLKLWEIINKPGAVDAWDAAGEAKQYADEAFWATKWKLPEEAKRAADTAWILGLKTEAIGKIRLSNRLPEISTEKRITGLNARRWVINEPEAGKAEAASELLVLLESSTHQLLSTKQSLSNEWASLGLDIIQSAGKLLEHYREMPTAQRGRESVLSELKANCRQAVEVMYELITKTAPRMRADLDLLELRFCSYWAAQPEDAATTYRQLVKADTFPANRQKVLFSQYYRLRYWSWEDRDKVHTLWENFIEELKQSTNIAAKCDMLLFTLRDQPMGKTENTDYWLEEEAKQFQATAAEVLKLIKDDTLGFRDEIDRNQLAVFEELIASRLRNSKQPWAIEMLKAQKERAFDRFYHYVRSQPDLPKIKLTPNLRQRSTEYHGQLDFEWTEARARKVLPYLETMNERSVSIASLENLLNYTLPELCDYLKKTQSYDQERFSIRFNKRTYTDAEADELRPCLEDFKARVPMAKYAVQDLIQRKLLTPKHLKETALRQQSEYTTKVETLRNTLKTGAAYDYQVFQNIAADYFTVEDARELLELWRAYLIRTKADKPLRSAEQHLMARTFTIAEAKRQFETATMHDPALLTLHIVMRFPTKDEAKELKPVFLEYARRMNLGDKVIEYHLRQLDRATGTSLIGGKASP